MATPTRARRPLPLLTSEQVAGLKPGLADPVEYRKSGLSLNHVVGCPLDCGYCVRHLFDNFEMKAPRALMSDEDAVAALVGHRYFRPHRTPLQVFNRATDPLLPVVKPHTFNVLRLLDAQGLTNHVLIITRWRVEPEDCAVLNSFQNLRLTVLVTHSGITDERIEPVDSRIAAASLRTLYEHAERYRTVLYWRPIVPALNDTFHATWTGVSSCPSTRHPTMFPPACSSARRIARLLRERTACRASTEDTARAQGSMPQESEQRDTWTGFTASGRLRLPRGGR
ncbi:hypothetical protein ACGRHY_27740 [Streptomyces sp. HK10]|uniref:hypothetical protein n=1 Tax=Streptomyces sp. HK10 TaxID=3373255 RepID=UPI003749596C